MTETRRIRIIGMILLAVVVGVIAALGSEIFRLMIALVHNLLFVGVFKLSYDANLPTALNSWGPWGIGVILVPPLTSFVVTWLTQTFAPEAKGHGVPEVMKAIHYDQGIIRPIVALIKSLASALTIGSGGSVGREGPIIQIGSAFGSTLGQLIAMPPSQRILLVSAGAAAAIAATFNAPLGGFVFAIELMLPSVDATAVMMVGLATVTATQVAHWMIGLQPAFDITTLITPLTQPISPLVMLCFIPFGLLCGVGCIAFIHAIYITEDYFDRILQNRYIRHALGMLLVGLILYLFAHFTGRYRIGSVGYATITDILSNLLNHPWLLLVLFFTKLLATSLTLGSGGSGGIFSPSLFLGATLGAFFRTFLEYLLSKFGDQSYFLCPCRHGFHRCRQHCCGDHGNDHDL